MVPAPIADTPTPPPVLPIPGLVRGPSLVRAPVVFLLLLAFGFGCRGSSPAAEEGADGPRRASLEGKVGYVSRPCGFDLDDDGVVGEAEDCRICDGRTADPDGDGVDEDLLYVDCREGEDSPACGSPDHPCRSLEFAWTVRADGPADGAEDVICFRGRCRPHLLTPAVAGVPGSRAEAPTAERPWVFEFPTDPTLLAGWDSDGDGVYPPHDPDDLAVLDGGPPSSSRPSSSSPSSIPEEGLSRAFVLGSGNSRLEMAHFTVVDYGRHTAVERSGFVHFSERGGLRADHLYFHDLSLRGINREKPAQGHRIVFNLFNGGTNFHHLAFVNLEVLDTAGFMVRGSGPYRPGTEAEGGNDGPYRWQNLTVTADGCDHSDEACRKGGGAAFIGWKLWGWIDGIEVLSSHFDAQVSAWEPKPKGNGGALLINATQCSRGWRVRGNVVKDFKVGFRAQGGDGAYCSHGDLPAVVRNDDRVDAQGDAEADGEGDVDGGADSDEPADQAAPADEAVFVDEVPRPTGDVVFDRNFFWNTYVPWRSGDYLVHLKGGDGLHRTLDTVTVSRNVLASSDGYDACMMIEVGHGGDPHGGPQPGWVEVADNTCWGARAEGRSTGIEISVSPSTRPFPQHHIRLRNNRIVGAKEGDYGLRLRYAPEALLLEGNIFSPAARFALESSRWASIEGLESALGLEPGPGAGSIECEPLFVDPRNGDFALHPDDTCISGARAETEGADSAAPDEASEEAAGLRERPARR